MKKRVLISAFACDPKTGSEPYVGFQWARMLADDVDLHVITRRYAKAWLEDSELAGKVTFHYVELPGCTGRNHYWRLIKPYYLLWQVAAFLRARALHGRQPFDIAHHLTYNNIDVPGLMWALKDVRFIWGPVGGGQLPPASLRQVYGRSWWRERVRGAMKWFAARNPLVATALRRAQPVIFANRDTASLVSRAGMRHELMLETAVASAGEAMAPRAHDGTVQLLWLGNAIPRKGLSLALDAFAKAVAQLDSASIRLTVVGGGSELEKAQLQAAALGLTQDQVRFVGSVPYSEVNGHFERSDAFLFSSVQDTSGNVVLEAMSHGLPVVALKHQGGELILADGGGILVPIASYEATTDAYAAAIVALAKDPSLRTRLGLEAWNAVRDTLSWPAKRQSVLRMYGVSGS